MPDVGIPVPPSRSILPGRKQNPDSRAGKIRALQPGESEYFACKQSIAGAAVFALQVHGRVPVGAKYVTRREGDGARVFRVK